MPMHSARPYRVAKLYCRDPAAMNERAASRVAKGLHTLMAAGLADESFGERCNWRIGGKSMACEEVLSDQASMAAAQAFDTDHGSDGGAGLTRWTCGHCKPETQRLRGMHR